MSVGAVGGRHHVTQSINNILVTEDSLIVAGEQRWRAAQLAGLPAVPVKVLAGVTADNAALVVRVRIEENLRRRELGPMGKARAVAKLYELAGIRVGGRTRAERALPDEGLARSPQPDEGLARSQQEAEEGQGALRTIVDIAETVHMSRAAALVKYHTLSRLIPPLAAFMPCARETLDDDESVALHLNSSPTVRPRRQCSASGAWPSP